MRGPSAKAKVNTPRMQGSIEWLLNQPRLVHHLQPSLSLPNND